MATAAKSDDAKATTTAAEEVESVAMPPTAPPLQETKVSEPYVDVAPPHVTDADAISYALAKGAEKTFVDPTPEAPAPVE